MVKRQGREESDRENINVKSINVQSGRLRRSPTGIWWTCRFTDARP